VEAKEKLYSMLSKQEPFSLIEGKALQEWLELGQKMLFHPGERILRPDELSADIYLVIKGTIRILGPSETGYITLDKRGPGQLLGWVSLLRAEPSECIQASTEVICLRLPSKNMVSHILNSDSFRKYFNRLYSIDEAYCIAFKAGLESVKKPSNWQDHIIGQAREAKVFAVPSGAKANNLPKLPVGWDWHISTPSVDGRPVGSIVKDKDFILTRDGFSLPIRLVGLRNLLQAEEQRQVGTDQKRELSPPDSRERDVTIDLVELGILEEDRLRDSQKYPIIRASGPLKASLAICEMLCLQQQIPFKRDAVEKVIKDQIRRDKKISIELIAGICELLGMSTQLAKTEARFITSIETPATLFWNDKPVILQECSRGNVVLIDPEKGLLKIPVKDFTKNKNEDIKFILARRGSESSTSRFGWHWFTPLIKKYKTALALVFLTSLLAQLFGLAIPLLIQQIIDKVLAQGNLSSLNVLGSTMIVLALFQGILQALRTYIFVDTTDRMDLTLGSSVIDRLLALPLKYFEKRPVGELSQRLGELNTIRSFLTGTALISALNLIFAVIYLIVMFIYSPLLSVISLSTFPLYLVLVLVVSPIYKTLIRNRAVAQAKTQSHLIEVIGGIQTVKAQHFELTARWKWQDRYRQAVNEGFKSTALGATAGETGNFLNQVSSLMVLWAGMWLVLKGEFTLGQLIAFRIISGNVTGPLLQLAGLYQGFQGVQLSMERLGDIVNQNPELNSLAEEGQISLPLIKGNVRFEDVSFRFGKSGPKQLESVSVDIPVGTFTGVVGQSGSGKSTLMKLLPRLYTPESGRILIDDYDVSKVELSSVRRQIGIVPQDSLLFEGTISDNIALNDPQASAESIIEAAKIACAHDFIMTLGQGYATPIAERGANLSGGQRQRIAIARTILSNPRMLIMDEATSALDYDTERLLCKNLQNWAKGRTVFFITHRLATIKSSGLILVMHQGRLLETGTHEQLLGIEGRYSTLYKQQEMG